MAKKTISQNNMVLNDIHEYGIDVENREIYLNSWIGNVEEDPGIDYRTSNQFIKNIRFLDNINNQPILIHLSSPGGEWTHGMAIYDMIINTLSPTIILVHGEVMSMGTIILQASDFRVMSPYSTFMIHYGYSGVNCEHKASISNSKWCEKITKQMIDIYASRAINSTGFSGKKKVSDVSNALKTKLNQRGDWYLDAEETLRFGLIDGILGHTSGYETIESLKII
jgi:ATP-dependent protease ClpP protease subunit